MRMLILYFYVCIQGAAILGSMLAENRCAVRRLHINDNQIVHFDCALENASWLQDFSIQVMKLRKKERKKEIKKERKKEDKTKINT